MRKSFLIALILLLPNLLAQEPSTPPPDDPNVFLMFLGFHEQTQEEVTSLRKLGDVDGANSLESGWHTRLHLSLAASAAISAAHHALTASLAVLHSEATAYANRTMANHERLDLSKMRSFEARRISTIRQTEASLKATLSQDDYQALFDFIENEFRPSARKLPLK
jgi:hypothetical protein